MRNFTFDIGDDGIAVIAWDMPGKSMNVIDETVMEELEAIVGRIRSDAAIKGAIFTSRKSTFSGGADLSMLSVYTERRQETSEETKRELLNKASRLSRLCRGMETSGKPLAAAINGTCLGGAFELALACHHRVAVDDDKARLGLPESKIGLLPGGGGTQRLPRLIGAEAALRLMLRGQHILPAEALKLGAVHAVAPAQDLIPAARRWLQDAPSAVQPWDRKDFRVPGGLPFTSHGIVTWAAANALYRKETFDNYDAQRAILSCVYEGLLVRSIDAGLAIEASYFTKLLLGRQAPVMIRSLFLSPQELNKGARRPRAQPEYRVRKLGIIGAGFMGAGVAHAAAKAGIEVVLIDRDLPSAEKGKAHSATLLDKQIARGEASEADKAALLSRIAPSVAYSDLAGCDLVIEAVFENREIKADVWARVDPVLAANAIRASNTSTLPITGLAQYVKDPSSFIGIHFFSPVDKMQLVEIIKGKLTSDGALAAALDFVRQIRKTPIVVNDSRGFFTSRVVVTHIAEGHSMLEEGIPPALIENAGKLAGMPVGPLALADEVALDLSWRILQATKADLGESYAERPIDRILEEMVVKRERFGRKNGRGYYDYPAGAKKRLWPGIGEVVALKDASQFDVNEIKERLLLIQALETARCFEEQVLTDVREADVGAILGFGFAPFTGGPLSYIDTMGVANFVAKCRLYQKRYGARYRPAKLLIEMAKKGDTFYGRFRPKVQDAA
jgi:3-hydroxyacyl-CoA dehydrogenase / enoyl-CoA hydratase / 3-hydroxybutyryl-CoA epimerase